MPLTRLTVLEAALAIADVDGVDALSMRRLAAELGVTPMALYNHVANRDDLLDGLADLVAGGIAVPSARWGWRRRLVAVLQELRAACLRHPAAAPLLQGARAMTPALLRPVEAGLEALEDAGLRADAARSGWAALVSLTFGHVAYQLGGHMRGPATGRGSLDSVAFPRIAAMHMAPPFDWDRAFARALEALVDGLVPGRASDAPAGRPRARAVRSRGTSRL
jgi:TetR/AcrR family tetracycline transcriptional repressor